MRPLTRFLARARFSRSFLVAGALCVANGCDKLKPNHDMYGDIVNLRDTREIAWNPAKRQENHSFQPAEYQYYILQGSTQYEFRAWLPDQTVTDDFTGRLNEIKKDVRLNSADIDWKWEIGGAFFACVSPISPNEPAASHVTVTLTPLSDSLPPPPVVYISRAEMATLRATRDLATHRQIACDILRRHGVAIHGLRGW